MPLISWGWFVVSLPGLADRHLAFAFLPTRATFLNRVITTYWSVPNIMQARSHHPNTRLGEPQPRAGWFDGMCRRD